MVPLVKVVMRIQVLGAPSPHDDTGQGEGGCNRDGGWDALGGVDGMGDAIGMNVRVWSHKSSHEDGVDDDDAIE